MNFRNIDKAILAATFAGFALLSAPASIHAQTPAAAPATPPAAAAPAAPATTPTTPAKKTKKSKAAKTEAAAAPAAPAAPAAAAGAGAPVFPSAVDTKYASQKPGDARMHTCLDQYHTNKSGTGNGGLKWIQKGGGYYSECSKKLKG